MCLAKIEGRFDSRTGLLFILLLKCRYPMSGIFAPHSGQKLVMTCGWWPQSTQAAGAGLSGAAHSGQNFAPKSSAPHDSQMSEVAGSII